MGFIDKIMDTMKAPATETQNTDAEQNQITDTATEEVKPEPETITDGVVEDGTEPVTEEKKSYSQEELDKILEDKKRSWETEQMNTLSKDGQIETLKAELLRRDLKDKVTARLDEEKLPLGVADFVQYTNEEETMKSLEQVITTVNQLVQDGITMRLKGRTPEGLGHAANNTLDAFSKSFLDAMGK